MLFFLLFIVLMPALTYADYRLYGKKMEENQPDYDQNLANYDALLAKLIARQKKTDTLVCAVLCVVAFVLGVYTYTAGGIM